MALAIPAAIGLFSALRDALKTSKGSRVRLNSHTHAFLQASNGWWKMWEVIQPPLMNLSPTEPLPPKGPAMLPKRASAAFASCPCPTVTSSPFCDVKHGPPPSPLNESQLPTLGDRSPTATSNSRPPSLNSMSFLKRLMCGPTPSTIFLTMRPPLGGKRKDPPQLRTSGIYAPPPCTSPTPSPLHPTS
jgi:hypothetical protein